MNDDLNLLVTIYQHSSYGDSLVKCAIKVPHGLNSFDAEFPMESAEKVRAWLPERIRSIGPVVAIEEIFDIVCDPVG